jgi:dTDP-4-dehydrorhamnose reductase
VASRLLITGAAGMLGQDLVDAAPAAVDVVALTHADLDIADADAVDRALTRSRPDVVINCAAWTDVDGAEGDLGGATAVNGTGAGNVARAANASGAWTIHVSSDYVFDGTKTESYVESDGPHPLSAYGRSKLAGELEVARGAPERHTVVRSSWLFGTHGRCFPATILRLAAERDELPVVDDQIGCPTFTGHLARALLSVAASETPPVGVLHVAGSGRCSWFEFATQIVELSELSCEIKPARTVDVPRLAPRPANSVLESERPAAPRLPYWREGLADYLGVRV